MRKIVITVDMIIKVTFQGKLRDSGNEPNERRLLGGALPALHCTGVRSLGLSAGRAGAGRCALYSQRLSQLLP